MKKSSKSATTSAPVTPAPAPAQPVEQPSPAPARAPKPFVNFQLRDQNRQLPAERVLDLLRRWMPRQYELAEVVGKWIWIRFSEAPEETVRAQLSQFGFHWNNVRRCWQHPCGHVTTGTPKEPREKYESYFPADLPTSPETYNGPARTAEQVAA